MRNQNKFPPYLARVCRRASRIFRRHLCDDTGHSVHTIGIDSIQTCWQTNGLEHHLLNSVRFHGSNTHDNHATPDKYRDTMSFASWTCSLLQKFVRNKRNRSDTIRNPSLKGKENIIQTVLFAQFKTSNSTTHPIGTQKWPNVCGSSFPGQTNDFHA